MSDKTSQIIDLGEALKRSMNERSTGEVAAIDDKCLEKYDALEGADADDFCPHCGAHWPRDENERAAVVKYLRKRAEGQPHVYDKQQINNLAYAIEKGAHIP